MFLDQFWTLNRMFYKETHVNSFKHIDLTDYKIMKSSQNDNIYYKVVQYYFRHLYVHMHMYMHTYKYMYIGPMGPHGPHGAPQKRENMRTHTVLNMNKSICYMNVYVHFRTFVRNSVQKQTRQRQWSYGRRSAPIWAPCAAVGSDLDVFVCCLQIGIHLNAPHISPKRYTNVRKHNMFRGFVLMFALFSERKWYPT